RVRFNEQIEVNRALLVADRSYRASGTSAAKTGRTRDRTRPMLQQRQKVLAMAPSTRDPNLT
ncbi:MAG: hypothetical protein WBZ25_02175, partial [Pseudolabrys sp.]